jgi:hypothetical protein
MVVSFSLLINDDYIFRDRGQLDVKGKGMLSTYFLLGQNGNRITEPEEIGRWFSPEYSTNETDCHDITEILLKVALNTITITH